MIRDFQESLQGKYALVTGATRGIGHTIAEILASCGVNLICHGRATQCLDKIASCVRSYGVDCFIEAVDVNNEEAIWQSSEKHKVDILVNCAGIFHCQDFTSYSTKDWELVIDTNLRGPFLYCRQFLPGMIERGWGRIINISSISGNIGEAYAPAYSASKSGLIGLTKSLALEVASKGITVNAICPGWVETDMSSNQINSQLWCKLNDIEPRDSQTIATLSVPTGRFIETKEVGYLTAFLASHLASSITGQAINICGGMCL